MSQVCAFQAADGSVRLVIPANPAADMAAIAAQALKEDPILGTFIGAIDDAGLPNRRFRKSWRIAAGSVISHFVTARAQLIAELRAQRDKILAQSDALKAKYEDIGTAAQKLAVFNYRQSLRDVTTQIQADVTAMTTVAQLEAYVAPIPAIPAGISL